jgi:uncharacterized protein
MHFLLFYDFVPNYLEKREEHRSDHLALAWRAHENGELMVGGAFKDTHDGAVLWFTGDTQAVAERFALADPYVKHGLVSRWWIRPWATVVGSLAASAVRPDR